jgi:predicted nucleic acid-binding Zn ribbon protein
MSDKPEDKKSTEDDNDQLSDDKSETLKESQDKGSESSSDNKDSEEVDSQEQCTCHCTCQEIFGSDLNEQKVKQIKIVLLLAGLLIILSFLFSFIAMNIADTNSIHHCSKFLY